METPDFAASNLRIAGIWPLPMASVPEALMNAIDGWDLPEELRDLGEAMGISYDEMEELTGGEWEGREAWELFNESLMNHDMSTWFCLAETPSYNVSEGGQMSYSWSCYNTFTIVAPTVEQAMKLAVEWADGEYETASASSKAKKEAA